MKMNSNITQSSPVLVLHNIRSVINVGAMVRTADAIGISKIYFTGYTPSPVDRFGRSRKDFIKASLGAETTVPWQSVELFHDLVKELQTEGYHVVAIEQSPRSVDIRDVKREHNMAFVFGNEVTGLTHDELIVCDSVAEIPMFGSKESLNVSVACGIALFSVLASRI